jgi:hypothetical protein
MGGAFRCKCSSLLISLISRLMTADLSMFQDFRVLRIQQNTWLSSSPLYKYLKQSDRVKTFCLGLWDTDIRSQLHGQLASILPRSIYRPRVFFYPSSRLLNYLPLVRDSAYASAITVYCSKAGLHGMKVHFRTDSVTFGEQKGYRLHFAIAEGEYLSSAWANIPSRTSITADVYGSYADTLCNVVDPISDFVFAVRMPRLSRVLLAERLWHGG